jgi:hypothetical protein
MTHSKQTPRGTAFRVGRVLIKYHAIVTSFRDEMEPEECEVKMLTDFFPYFQNFTNYSRCTYGRKGI